MNRSSTPSPWRTRCPETGKDIKKGELCLYDPLTKKAYSIDSYTYKKWHENEVKKRK
jgi:hypothetical protein